MSIAILAENVSAIPRAILALKSIGNTGGDTLKVSPIPAIAILLLRYSQPWWGPGKHYRMPYHNPIPYTPRSRCRPSDYRGLGERRM